MKIAKAFMMGENTFMRHANPWSGHTRFSMLPLLALAFWSRIWIGWWSIILVHNMDLVESENIPHTIKYW